VLQLNVNVGDQGAEQTGARNAIFKSASQTIHFLNDHNFNQLEINTSDAKVSTLYFYMF
jgi:uncharacterized protein YggE